MEGNTGPQLYFSICKATIATFYCMLRGNSFWQSSRRYGAETRPLLVCTRTQPLLAVISFLIKQCIVNIHYSKHISNTTANFSTSKMKEKAVLVLQKIFELCVGTKNFIQLRMGAASVKELNSCRENNASIGYAHRHAGKLFFRMIQ